MTNGKLSNFKNLSVFGLIFLMAACVGSSSSLTTSTTTSNSDGTSSQTASGSSGATTQLLSNVSAVTIDGQSATLDLNADGSKNYVMAVYSYNSAGSTNAFQVGISGSESAKVSALVTDSKDLTEDFHQMLRLSESKLDESLRLPEASSLPSARLKKASLALELGDTREFKVLSSFSNTNSYVTVSAELVYESDNFLAYMDSDDLSALTEDELTQVLASFDEVIGDEQGLFGTTTDVDGDGRFNILFTHRVNALGGRSGGITTGYFYAVDLFDADVYSASNETEILYAAVPDPTGTYGAAISKEFALTNILPSVLPHEYQHIINFNMHYNVNDGAAEQAFLNEALSHLAEDIYSLDSAGYMPNSGVENAARVAGYLKATDTICFTCGSSLYQRGGSYLFIRFLYEQAEKGNLEGAGSGAEFIANLLDSDLTGVSNVVSAALGVGDEGEQMKNLLGRFALAMFLDDMNLTADSHYNIDGLNLRSIQNDNRSTLLDGPEATELSASPLSGTVAGSSISYITISSADIETHGNSIPLEFSADDNMNVGAFLVELE